MPCLDGFAVQVLTNHQIWNEGPVVAKVAAPAAFESKYGNVPAAKAKWCVENGKDAGVNVGEGK